MTEYACIRQGAPLQLTMLGREERSPAACRVPDEAAIEVTGEWFAGFVDGEGSLGIAGHGGLLQPRFRLNQRLDDAHIVRAIRGFLGCGTLTLKRYTARQKYYSPNARPQLALNVNGKDCSRLVELFDAHPLRSKKRHEYPIWREAVVFYAARQFSRWTPEPTKQERNARMRELKRRLEGIRQYAEVSP